MGRVILLGFVVLAAAGVLWVLWSEGPRPEGVHLSGDGAPEVARFLGDAGGTPVETAALTVTLLHRWSNLQHLPGAVELCGAACAKPAVLVRVIDLAPGRSRKHLILLAREGTPEGEPNCVARLIAAEGGGLGRAEPPGCAAPALGAEGAQVTLWVLPWGLGRLGGPG